MNERREERSNPVEHEAADETLGMPLVRPRARRGAVRGVRGWVSKASGGTLILAGIGTVALIIVVLVGLIAFVVQSSGHIPSANSARGTLVIEFSTAAPTLPAPKPSVAVVQSGGTATAPGAGASGSVALRIETPTAEAARPADVLPGNILVGGFVQVTGTEGKGMRLRSGPGLTYTTNKVVEDGIRFKVLQGPEENDSFRWWRLQDKDGGVGWAAEAFLKPAPTAAFE